MASRYNFNKSCCRLVFVLLICIFLVSFVSAGEFDLSERNLKFKINPEETQEISFNIRAVDTGQFSFVTTPSWASVSENSFLLKAGEQKSVLVKINGAGLSEGVYVSSLLVKSDDDMVVLPLVLEVQSKDMFFGGSLDIPLKYQEISPSDTLLAQLRIYDLVSPNSDVKLGAADVEVTYTIYPIQGEAILRDSEKVKVDNMLQLSKVISFNKDVAVGTYVLAAIVKYGDGISTSTSLFQIKKNSFFNLPSISIPPMVLFWLLVALCLIVLAYIAHELKKWFSLNKEDKRIDVQRSANSLFKD